MSGPAPGLLLAALVALAAAGPARAADEPEQSAPAATGFAGRPVQALKPLPSGREAFREIARREASRHGLPFEMADAVMRVESAYQPFVRGAAGEVGLMQVMPPTARMLGFAGTLEELADPETNIALGVRYLAEAWRLAGGDICTAAMKYRAGHRETRFSVLSVRYCRNVRVHLASLGYPLTGEVPEPTFGFRSDTMRMGVVIGTQQAARRLATGGKIRSRVGWGDYDRRMRDLTARGRVSL